MQTAYTFYDKASRSLGGLAGEDLVFGRDVQAERVVAFVWIAEGEAGRDGRRHAYLLRPPSVVTNLALSRRVLPIAEIAALGPVCASRRLKRDPRRRQIVW
jgi:hypothetical protein